MADQPKKQSQKQSRVGRLWVNLLAAALTLVLLAAVVLWQSQSGTHDDAPNDNTVSDVGSALTRQLDELAGANSKHDFVRAAGDDADAHAWSHRVWDNLRLLGADDLRLRYVSGGEAAVDANGTRQARVEVRWTPGEKSGFAAEPTSAATVLLTVRPLSGERVAILDAQHDDGRMPLWLAGKLEREKDRGARVYTVDGGSDAVDGTELGGNAVTQVRDVLDNATFKPLVLVVPHEADTTADLLDRKPGDIEGLAAVTSSLDGSEGKAARAIFSNPEEFDSMDDRAAQVVMTHEATHGLTAAVGSSGPSWVIEGFADWVALHDDTAGLAKSAGKILRQVDENGAPRQLPDSDDFAAASDDLGAVYESAWMVFRMLAEHNDDADIIAFYRDVLDGVSADDAAQQHLGVDVEWITKKWRRYLEKSASTVSG